MSRLRICLDFLYRRGGVARAIPFFLLAMASQALPGQGLLAQATWSARGKC
jgi:predicted benzoate:H+ symporter BenE